MSQGFSPDNLRRVWDLETRRGRDLLEWFPEVHAAFVTWRTRRMDTFGRRTPSKFTIEQGTLPGAAEVAKLKESAEVLLTEALTAASEELVASVEGGSFTWGLHALPVQGTRQFYSTSKTVTTYFADKQLQRNIGTFLENRPSSRHEIVAGLAGTLRNDLPKVLVRADIADFYNTVDHAILLGRLNKTRLSPTSLRLIRSLLTEFEGIAGIPRGLPTGVGLSAKLAELYLSDLDTPLRSLPEVMFYGRYVDDIVMVVGQRDHGSLNQPSLLSAVKAAMADLKLQPNMEKQSIRELSDQGVLKRFEFLGYAIEYAGGELKITLTKDRQARIKKRVERVLDLWDMADPSNHGRRSLLLDRLSFLAGNTRLSHNKRNAMVGIYFSNDMVSDSQSLSGLDSWMKARLSKSTFPASIQLEIDNMSFVKAFDERSMRRFTPKRLRQIRGAWRG